MSNKLKYVPIANTAVFILFLVLSALIIYIYPREIMYDQGFIKYIFSFSGYPSIEAGVMSNLIVGLYNKFILCSSENINTHIRILAMVMYYVAAFMLGKKAIKNQFLLLTYILFIFTSQYQFLWLSSELFVGALLFFAVYAIINSWNVLLVSLLLVLLGFTKPDVIFLSFVMLIYCFCILSTRKEKIMLVASYMLFLLLLIMPGVINKGLGYVQIGGRSFVSFGQHYSALVYGHQLIRPVPEPWNNWNQYMSSIFPEANTLADVINMYTKKYVDFVMLSIGQGMKNLFILLKYLFIFLPLIFIYHIHKMICLKRFMPLKRIEQIILLTLFGFIPFFLFSYPHIRYLARYYPLFIIFILVFIERLLCEKGSKLNLLLLMIGIFVLCISLINSSRLLFYNLANIENIVGLWFGD